MWLKGACMGFFTAAREKRTVADLNGREFETFLMANELVCVEFYMAGCLHCKHMDPVFLSLAVDLEDRVGFAKVNAPANLDVACRYGVSVAPTYIVFSRGETADEVVGKASIEVLKGKLLSRLWLSDYC